MKNKPLSTLFLLKQKQCCGNKCINCPYVPQHVAGSLKTIDQILLEPVSILEYYGVDIRVINALESYGWYVINDLKNMDNSTNIFNVRDKSIASIRNALRLLLGGSPPDELSFENTR